MKPNNAGFLFGTSDTQKQQRIAIKAALDNKRLTGLQSQRLKTNCTMMSARPYIRRCAFVVLRMQLSASLRSRAL